MDSERSDLFRIIDLYSSAGYRLFSEGTGLRGYIIDKLLHTENPFSRAAEAEGAKCLTGKMAGAVVNDLGQLQILASIRSEWIRDFMLYLCKEDEGIQEAVMKLPLWPDEPDKDDANTTHRYERCYCKRSGQDHGVVAEQ
jgi:hypothetical protein